MRIRLKKQIINFKTIFSVVLFLSLNIISCRDNSSDDFVSPPKQITDGWPVSFLAKQGIDEIIIEDLHNKIADNYYSNVHSVLIIRNGYLVFEEYYNGYDIDDLHRLYSITKSVSSGLIGIAIEKNIIGNALDSIPEYLSEYVNIDWSNQKDEITIADLLTMRSGIDWEELAIPYPDPQNSHRQMTSSNDWLQFVLQRPMAYPPGEYFEYNTGTSNLLAKIIANSSGIEADSFAVAFLLSKLDISDFSWFRDPQGNPCTGGTAGGLHLKPRDLAKIGYVYLNSGIWNDTQVIPPDWISESTTKHVAFAGNQGYGYQWWHRQYNISGSAIETVYALGYGGQYMFVIEQLDMIVVYLSGNYERSFAYSQALEIMNNYILPAAIG